ncbi:MAG: hypothetical protein HN904_12780, partial [Victivallales bacterium]|nr:hypothetical protein [Victivallales bacterium]
VADFDPPDGLDLQITTAATNYKAAAANVTLGADDSVRVSNATFTCGQRTNAGVFEIIGATGTLQVNGDLAITGTERWLNTTVEIAAGVTVRVESGGLLEIDECDISLATGAVIETQPGGALSLLASSVAGGSILLQANAGELRGCLLDAGCRLSVSGDQCQVMHNAFVGAAVSDTGVGNRWHDAAWGNAWLNGTPPASVADAAPASWWQGTLYGTVGIRWLGAEEASPFARAVAIALNGTASDELALSFTPVATEQVALAFWQLAPEGLPEGALRVSLKPDNSLREARGRGVSRSPVFEFVADDGTAPAPGDLDSDNRVDDDDLDILRANWLTPGPRGDLNDDGTVDLLDYQVLKPAYGHAGKGL